MRWCCFPGQIRYRFVGDIHDQRDKANPYNSEAQLFVSFSSLNVLIDRHSPKQRGTGCNLNEAVHSKPNKRDASS
jgi:hypothetical protein